MIKTDLILVALSFSLVVGVAHAQPYTADETGPPPETRKIDQALARSVVDRIAADVERLRGLPFKQDVSVAVVSDDEAIARTMQRLEEFGELEDLAWAEKVLKVLGLAKPDDDLTQLVMDALREQIGGYYDPGTDQFYLLDDMPAAMVDILTAHELTHALEDQYYNLEELLVSDDVDDDHIFARGAVTEGSATLLMTIYTVEQAIDQSLGEDEIMEMANIDQEAMRALPEALVRELMAPYILGMAFVQGGNAMAWASGGFPAAKINAIYAAPPLSSEQILHPEKYWKDDKRDDPLPVSLGTAGEGLGRGWTMQYEGVLGELNMALLVGATTPEPDDPQAMMGASWTNRAATGWGGDRFELWTRGKKNVVLLSTLWDSTQDAEQFVEAIVRAPHGMRADGNAVALVYGNVPQKRTADVLGAMLRESLGP
jgi:hypothetical protein